MPYPCRFYSRWELGRRYYELRLQPDLWGTWCVIRVWGESGHSASRPVTLAMNSYQEAVAEYERQRLLRRQHGYRLAHEANEPTPPGRL